MKKKHMKNMKKKTKTYNKNESMCSCNNMKCPVNNEKTYDKFSLISKKFIYTNENNTNGNILKTIKFMNIPYYCYNRIRSCSKCEIFTDYYKLRQYTINLRDELQDVLTAECDEYEEYAELQTKNEILQKFNFDLIRKVVKKDFIINDINNRYDDLENEKKIIIKNNKSLFNHLKKLERQIDRYEDILKKIGDNYEYDDDNDYDEYDNNNDTDSNDTDSNENDDNIDYILNYEKVNKYMNEKYNGVRDFCSKNRFIKRKILNAYFNLRLHRNLLAHPDITEENEIKNDDELISLLIK